MAAGKLEKNKDHIFKSDVSNVSLTWTIPNFRMLKDNIGYQLQSSKFYCEYYRETLYWCLSLYPGGKFANKYVAVYLHTISDKKDTSKYAVQFSFIIAGHLWNHGLTKIDYFDQLAPTHGFDSFIHRDILLNEKNEWLTDGTSNVHDNQMYNGSLLER